MEINAFTPLEATIWIAIIYYYYLVWKTAALASGVFYCLFEMMQSALASYDNACFDILQFVTGLFTLLALANVIFHCLLRRLRLRSYYQTPDHYNSESTY